MSEEQHKLHKKHILNRVKDRYLPGVKKFAINSTIMAPVISIRDNQPDIYDQLDLGSCTANGAARALETEMIRQGEQALKPSRLFIYYNTRVAEGDPKVDDGAQICDAIASVVNFGACGERVWPYHEAKFAVKPDQAAYNKAIWHKATESYSVHQSIQAFKTALSQGIPIVFGITAYSGLESDSAAETGYVPLPGVDEQPIGGHCITMTGVNDITRRIEFANSWSSAWGDKGYGTLDYDYVLNPDLASDFWVVVKAL